MTPVVELANVTAYRGEKKVLDIESLTVRKGEHLSVVGPNGAGKSTLLQVINLLLPIRSGEIFLFGRKVHGPGGDVLRRRASLVFQEPLLLKDTVFNNVSLPLNFRGVPKEAAEQRVHDALRTFRCDHLAGRLAQRLSGGEAQRVCLARALVCEPELLLLDEPFTALDPAARHALVLELMQIASKREMTLVIISHQLLDILNYTERAIVIQDGRIVQDGAPETVLRKPVNAVVAQMVGMDNILPCQVVRGGGGATVRLSPEHVFALRTVPAGDEAFCCLPGDVFFPEEGGLAPDTPWVRLEVKVRQVIPGIGVSQAVVEDRGLVLNIRVPREVARRYLSEGGTVRLAFDPAEAHLVV